MADSDFVTGAFFQYGAFGWLSAAWTEPRRLIVRTPVAHGRPDEAEQRVLPLREEDEQRLQQLASGLLVAGEALGGASRGTYVLDLDPARGGERTRIVWSPGGEPEPLAETRRHLQQAAHLAYYEARLALERGRDDAQRDEYDQACRTYRAGLDALGDRYAGPELDDDTEVKLLLARSREREGNFAAAAAILERVLEARLTVYAQREKLPL